MPNKKIAEVERGEAKISDAVATATTHIGAAEEIWRLQNTLRDLQREEDGSQATLR